MEAGHPKCLSFDPQPFTPPLLRSSENQKIVNMFSPNSVDTPEVLVVVVKHRCLIGVARSRFSVVFYSTFAPLKVVRRAFQLRTLAEICGVTFRARQGKPRFSWSKVDFS